MKDRQLHFIETHENCLKNVELDAYANKKNPHMIVISRSSRSSMKGKTLRKTLPVRQVITDLPSKGKQITGIGKT